MSDNWRKTLTKELLGECWHDWHRSAGFWNWLCHKCEKEMMIQVPHRTFSTWQDVGDVKEKLVEMGRWDEFYNWMMLMEDASAVESKAVAWLFRCTNEQGEPHFCKLVYDAGVELGWWREGRRYEGN